MLENMNISRPRIPQTTRTGNIDSRDAPADTVSPLFGDGTDSVVAIALSATTDVTLPVNLHSGVCVAALAVGSVHAQPIQSAGLPPHV